MSRFADSATFSDLIRHVVRSFHWPDEATQQDALHIVDAHDNGYADLGSWRAELDKRAVAARRAQNPGAPETDGERADRLQAELTQLQARVGAAAPTPQPANQTPPADATPATPGP